MDSREISEEYAIIGQEVIENEPSLVDIRNGHATIIYLTSEKRKCQRVKRFVRNVKKCLTNINGVYRRILQLRFSCRMLKDLVKIRRGY